MGTGIKRWEGFRGLRTYQPVLQADLRELERIVQEIQRQLGSLLLDDPLGGTTIIHQESITNISAALADPTAQVILTPVAGTATTAIRSDGAPRLSVGISPTGVEAWTGTHEWKPATNTAPATITKTATLTSADLLNIRDTDLASLFKVDNVGHVGVNTEDPSDAMAVITGATNAVGEERTVLNWPDDGTERGFYQQRGTAQSPGGWNNPDANDFTLDVWIKIASTADTANFSNVTIIGEAGAGAGIGGFIHDNLFIDSDAGSGGALRYFCFNNSDGPVASASTAPTTYKDDLWHHVACVHERTSATGHKMSIFVDGVYMAVASGSGASQSWSLGEAQRDVGIGAGIGVLSRSLQGVTLAGVKYRDGRQYLTTTDGSVVGTTVFTPVLPSAVTGNIKDVDMDEGVNFTLVEDVEPGSFINSNSGFVWGTDTVTLTVGGDFDLTHWRDTTEAIVTRVNDSGWIGHGVDPTHPLDILSTQQPQVRFGYDGSNYLTFNINSAGDATIATTGTTLQFSDLIGIGVTPTSALHIRSTTSPQLRVEYDATHHITAAVASTGAVTIRPTTDDAAGMIQVLLHPGNAVTPALDSRAILWVNDSNAVAAGNCAFVIWPDRRVEIGGARGATTSTFNASLGVLPTASTFAGGMFFSPIGTTNAGITVELPSCLFGAYFAQTPTGSTGATNCAGGIFVGNHANNNGMSAHGGVFKATRSSGGPTQTGFTFTGYGFRVLQPTLPSGSGDSFGRFTDYYGGYIAAHATGSRVVNSYGLYLEEVVSTNAINVIKTGIFLAAATNGYKAITIANQNNHLSWVTGDAIKFNGNNGLIWSVTGNDQITLTPSVLAFADTASAFTLQTSGTNGLKVGMTGDRLGFYGTTPVVQPDGTSPVHTTLDTLGLRVNLEGDTYGIVCSGDEVMVLDDVVVVL